MFRTYSHDTTISFQQASLSSPQITWIPNCVLKWGTLIKASPKAAPENKDASASLDDNQALPLDQVEDEPMDDDWVPEAVFKWGRSDHSSPIEPADSVELVDDNWVPEVVLKWEPVQDSTPCSEVDVRIITLLM